jgi:CDP-diglyceride synthetase
MTDNFLLKQSLLLIAPLLFISLFAVTVVGYFIGKRHGKKASDSEKREKTVGTITGAMLALLGFILAIGATDTCLVLYSIAQALSSQLTI